MEMRWRRNADLRGSSLMVLRRRPSSWMNVVPLSLIGRRFRKRSGWRCTSSRDLRTWFPFCWPPLLPRYLHTPPRGVGRSRRQWQWRWCPRWHFFRIAMRWASCRQVACRLTLRDLINARWTMSLSWWWRIALAVPRLQDSPWVPRASTSLPQEDWWGSHIIITIIIVIIILFCEYHR